MAEVNGYQESVLKRVNALQAQVDKLEGDFQLDKVPDTPADEPAAESEVRKLHFKYGYYLDKCLYRQTVDLFADHPDTYVQFLNGRFRGKAGVKRLYIERFQANFTKGRNGPVHGFLLDHLHAQDIVDFYSNTEPPKAKGRFRALMSAGTHDSMDGENLPRGLRQWWEGGLYENEYIKEDGVWKIFRLRYFPFWHGVFESGWQHTPPDYVAPFAKTLSDGDPLGPDELLKHDERLWPDTRVVPFHYAHPITGEQVDEADLWAPPLGRDASEAKPARVIEDSF